MRCLILIFVFFIVVSHGKRFVLLDPDDSDLDKSASSIPDAEVRMRSIKMAKFRKWLKYDVDCDFIEKDELVVKRAQGRCPPESEADKTTTTTTKAPRSFFFKRKRTKVKKDRSLFSHQNKKAVIRAVVGSGKMQEIDWSSVSASEMELVGGSMVTLKCDDENRKQSRKKQKKSKKTELEVVEWFVNGKRIESRWYDWRVSVSWEGNLGIWPIGVDDGGHFECTVNGQLRASVTVNVVPMSKILLRGLLNYLSVCAIFGVATVSIGCLLGARNLEKKEKKVDRMEEFLAANVFKTDQMAKEAVAAIIERQGVVDEQKMIEQKASGNRSTIMLLLQNPDIQNLAKTPKKIKNLISKGTMSSDVESKGTSDAGTSAGTTAETTGTDSSNKPTTSASTDGTETKRTEETENPKEDVESSEEEEDEDVGTKGSVSSGASKGPGKNKKKKTSKDTKKKGKKPKNGKKKTKTKAKKGTKSRDKGAKNKAPFKKSKPTTKKKK